MWNIFNLNILCIYHSLMVPKANVRRNFHIDILNDKSKSYVKTQISNDAIFKGFDTENFQGFALIISKQTNQKIFLPIHF